jgi:hypothetical protein
MRRTEWTGVGESEHLVQGAFFIGAIVARAMILRYVATV